MVNWPDTTTFYLGVNLGTNSKIGIGSTDETFAENGAWTWCPLIIPSSSKCSKRSWLQVYTYSLMHLHNYGILQEIFVMMTV